MRWRDYGDIKPVSLDVNTPSMAKDYISPKARPAMIKNAFSCLLVISLIGFVPQIVSGQAAPSASTENNASSVRKAAPTRAPSRDLAQAEAILAGKSTGPLTLAENVPSTYIVVKGDTLWDISGKFLKEPWRWPEIWNMNRDQVKDPHWIYPGDVISLSFDADGRPRLSLNGVSGGSGGTVRLSPSIRIDKLSQAIPSIPARVIGPFLTMPLVVDAGALAGAPKIVSADDDRVVIGAGDRAYAVGMQADQGTRWQVYRPGKALIDPNSRELLGYEALYLGDSTVSRFGEVATIDIVKSTQEINKGDRLTPATEGAIPSYSPRAPDKTVNGSILSIVGGVSEGGQYSVIVLNLGRREGMEVGHVLATLRTGAAVSTNTDSYNSSPAISGGSSPKIPRTVKLPDERNGLVFVFRVFDKVSYALVMSSGRSVKVGDAVQTP